MQAVERLREADAAGVSIRRSARWPTSRPPRLTTCARSMTRTTCRTTRRSRSSATSTRRRRKRSSSSTSASCRAGSRCRATFQPSRRTRLKSATRSARPWPLPAVVVSYHITFDGNPDSYPLHILAKILSDGDSSRIYRALVYEKQIALAAFGEAKLIEHPNLFYAVAIAQPGHKPEEVQKALQDELDRVKTEGVTADELNRAKRQFARDYILGRETVQQKALQLAHAVVIHNDIKTADGEFDLFQNVTVADVQRVARTYFTPESRMLLTVLPGPAGRRWRRWTMRARIGRALVVAALLASASLFARGSRRWPKSGSPPPLPSRPVVVPALSDEDARQRPAGLVVLHHEEPAVSFRLLIRAGAMQEPADKPGVASFVAPLLNQGTTTQVGGGDCQRDRIRGRGRGRRIGQRALVRQRRRRQGPGRSRARPGLGHGPASGVCARGDRSAAQADALVAPGELRRSGLHRGSRLRSAGVRVPSLRPAERRHAGVDRARSRATTSSRSPARGSSRTTRSSRSSAT